MVNHNTPNKNRSESTEVTLSGNRSTFRDHLPSLANKTGAPMWVKKMVYKSKGTARVTPTSGQGHCYWHLNNSSQNAGESKMFVV